MKIDKSRTERQLEAIVKWRNNKGAGCIVAPPGFGKTNIGVQAINKHVAAYPNAKVLILVPSERTQKQWKHETDAPVITYNTAKNNIDSLTNQNFTLLVIDELHKFTSDDNIALIKTLLDHVYYRLALTATFPYDCNALVGLFPIVDSVKEEEALNNNWISPFLEYNVPVKFSEEEQDKYANYSHFITETLNLFKDKYHCVNSSSAGVVIVNNDLDFIYACYAGKKYKGKYIKATVFREVLARTMGWSRDLDLSNEDNRVIEVRWNPNNILERAKRFKTIVEHRNELINCNNSKLEAVIKLLEMNSVPTIIFNESTEFVNLIATELGEEAIAYHSNIKSRPVIDKSTGEFKRYSTGKIIKFGAARLKEEAIEGMKAGRYKYLVTARALDEGLNLPMLKQVIITAGSSNPLQQIQRSGRGKRVYGNKVARIVNIYLDDYHDANGNLIRSRDKIKLITRQRKYDHTVSWVQDITDIAL